MPSISSFLIIIIIQQNTQLATKLITTKGNKHIVQLKYNNVDVSISHLFMFFYLSLSLQLAFWKRKLYLLLYKMSIRVLVNLDIYVDWSVLKICMKLIILLNLVRHCMKKIFCQVFEFIGLSSCCVGLCLVCCTFEISVHTYNCVWFE